MKWKISSLLINASKLFSDSAVHIVTGEDIVSCWILLNSLSDRSFLRKRSPQKTDSWRQREASLILQGNSCLGLLFCFGLSLLKCVPAQSQSCLADLISHKSEEAKFCCCLFFSRGSNPSPFQKSSFWVYTAIYCFCYNIQWWLACP